MVSGWQPEVRRVYVTHMLGVDAADQYIGSHAHKHRPVTYFWRREFDQKIGQALTNAFLIFRECTRVLGVDCDDELLKQRDGDAGVRDVSGTRSDGGSGGGGVDGTGAGGGSDTPLSVDELKEFSSLLKQLSRYERVAWDQGLADHLMSKCNVGNSQMGRRRTARGPVTRTYDSKALAQARLCIGGFCNKAAKKCKPTAQRTRKQIAENTKETRTRTSGLCWCGVCTDDVGVEAAVPLCHFCSSVPEAHIQAGKTSRCKRTASGKKKKTKPITWAAGKKPSEPS